MECVRLVAAPFTSFDKNTVGISVMPVKLTAPCRKKARAEQRRIRRNQPPVSSVEARRQFEQVLKGSLSIGQNINQRW